MLKQCKYCGKQYDGDPGSSACPECVTKRKKSTLADRVCQSCGVVFPGGPAARYCPDCRAERHRQQDRECKVRQRAGTVRKLGSTDLCAICGKPYTVEGGKQMYCKDCAEEAIRQKDRASALLWAAKNTTPEARRVVRAVAIVPKQCVICNKEFIPHNSAKTCSAACSRELQKRNAAAFERRHAAERNEYHRRLRQEKKNQNNSN